MSLKIKSTLDAIVSCSDNMLIGSDNKKKKLSSRKTGLLILGLAAWYSMTTPTHITPTLEKYRLPTELVVTETDLPKHQRTDSLGNKEYYINTSDLDNVEKFDIWTPRYHIVKDEDWAINRYIGYVASLPRKLFFWDWNVSNGIDKEKSKAVISIL